MAWEGTQLVLLVVCLAVVCSNDTGSDNVGPMVTDKVRPFIYSSTTSLMLSRDGWNPSVCPGTYIRPWFVKTNRGENVFFQTLIDKEDFKSRRNDKIADLFCRCTLTSRWGMRR